MTAPSAWAVAKARELLPRVLVLSEGRIRRIALALDEARAEAHVRTSLKEKGGMSRGDDWSLYELFQAINRHLDEFPQTMPNIKIDVIELLEKIEYYETFDAIRADEEKTCAGCTEMAKHFEHLEDSILAGPCGNAHLYRCDRGDAEKP